MIFYSVHCRWGTVCDVPTPQRTHNFGSGISIRLECVPRAHEPYTTYYVGWCSHKKTLHNPFHYYIKTNFLIFPLSWSVFFSAIFRRHACRLRKRPYFSVFVLGAARTTPGGFRNRKTPDLAACSSDEQIKKKKVANYPPPPRNCNLEVPIETGFGSNRHRRFSVTAFSYKKNVSKKKKIHNAPSS